MPYPQNTQYSNGQHANQIPNLFIQSPVKKIYQAVLYFRAKSFPV